MTKGNLYFGIIGIVGIVLLKVIDDVMTDSKKLDRERAAKEVVDNRPSTNQEVLDMENAMSDRYDEAIETFNNKLDDAVDKVKEEMKYDSRMDAINKAYDGAVRDVYNSHKYEATKGSIHAEAASKKSELRVELNYDSEIARINNEINREKRAYDHVKTWADTFTSANNDDTENEAYKSAKKAAKKSRDKAIKALEEEKDSLEKKLKTGVADIERDENARLAEFEKAVNSDIMVAKNAKNAQEAALRQELQNKSCELHDELKANMSEEDRNVLIEYPKLYEKRRSILSKEHLAEYELAKSYSKMDSLAYYLAANKWSVTQINLVAMLPMLVVVFGVYKYWRTVNALTAAVKVYSV